MTADLLAAATGRLAALPLFSAADYAELNPDVAQAGMDPAEHALLHGCVEGRPVFRRDRVARTLGEAIARTSCATPPSVAARAPRLPAAVSVFVSSASGPAAADLAACLAADLARAGAAAVVETERSLRVDAAAAAIVVAPHEFFRLGLGPGWRGTALPRTALMVNTAPLLSAGFVSGLPFLLASRGVLDLSPQVVDIVGRAGLPARLVRPCTPIRDRWLAARDAGHPLVEALPAGARHPALNPGDPRPIDLCFTGARTPRRDRAFARMAAEFTDLATFVHFPSCPPSPAAQVRATRAPWRFAGHLAARSKVALSVGADEQPDPDWWPMFQAMAAGAVVASDHAPPHPDLRVGTHLFSDDLRHLPDLVRWLLEDDGGRAAATAAQAAARALVSDPANSWTADAAALWADA